MLAEIVKLFPKKEANYFIEVDHIWYQINLSNVGLLKSKATIKGEIIKKRKLIFLKFVVKKYITIIPEAIRLFGKFISVKYAKNVIFVYYYYTVILPDVHIPLQTICALCCVLKSTSG